ncbi:MAG: hypothetical protein DRQ46_00465 [Gammaproteobacteria bacterium]|nr:MAG: hypothetical protein DRQ46_00465 [Gammaproteobacteria bacterium]
MSIDAKIAIKLPNMDVYKKAVDVTQPEMLKSALFIRQEMLKRLETGRDIFLKPFKPYAKSTKEYKKEMRKNPNIVNMEDSGQMINSLRTNAKVNRSIVDIANAQRRKIADKHMEGRGVPKRAWFGSSQKTVKKVIADIRKIMDQHIRRANAK